MDCASTTTCWQTTSRCLETWEQNMEAGRRINNCSVEELAQSHRLRFQFYFCPSSFPLGVTASCRLQRASRKKRELWNTSPPRGCSQVAGRWWEGSLAGHSSRQRSPRRWANANGREHIHHRWWPWRHFYICELFLRDHMRGFKELAPEGFKRLKMKCCCFVVVRKHFKLSNPMSQSHNQKVNAKWVKTRALQFIFISESSGA